MASSVQGSGTEPEMHWKKIQVQKPVRMYLLTDLLNTLAIQAIEGLLPGKLKEDQVKPCKEARSCICSLHRKCIIPQELNPQYAAL